ncbi:MAG: class III extradiol ring-cleavage dioxygenase [Oligoflexales bacterium]
MNSLPTYFISHGGGPWPWMEELSRGKYSKLDVALRAMPQDLEEQPKAVLIITAHWEEKEFVVGSSPAPGMIYDYGGFPPHTYQVKYDAPGAPELAKKVHGLLQEAGLASRLDAERGYDHGTFVPLAVIFPKADVPVVQLSIRKDYDPKTHIAMGEALASLRNEGVLIIGSGLSYHNLKQFGPQASTPSKEFDAWLQDAVVRSDANQRINKLMDWVAAPSARLCHPREDHLVPLFVAVGAAKAEKAVCCYHEEDFAGGLAVSSFRFG